MRKREKKLAKVGKLLRSSKKIKHINQRKSLLG